MIINATPHPINVYSAESADYNKELRKNIVRDGVSPCRTIEPSGILLNARMETVEDGSIDGIPISASRPSAVDNPPEDGWIVVSRMYAAAAAAVGSPALTRMLVVHNPVYRVTADGAIAPCGCLGLEKV